MHEGYANQNNAHAFVMIVKPNICTISSLHNIWSLIHPCCFIYLGIHSGPVESGIVGSIRRRFTLFGDT